MHLVEHLVGTETKLPTLYIAAGRCHYPVNPERSQVFLSVLFFHVLYCSPLRISHVCLVWVVSLNPEVFIMACNVRLSPGETTQTSN